MATEKQFGAVFKESYESFVNRIVKEAEQRHGPITAGDVLAAERILESLNSNGGCQRNLKSSVSDPMHIRPASSVSKVKKSWTHSGILSPSKVTADDDEVVPCTQYPSAADGEADKENIIPETPYLRKQFLKGRISPEGCTATTPFSMAQRTQNTILQTPVSTGNTSHRKVTMKHSSTVNHAFQSTLSSCRQPSPSAAQTPFASCPPTLPRHDDDDDDDDDDLHDGNQHRHYKPSTILPQSSSSLSPMEEEELAYITRRMSFSRATNADTNNHTNNHTNNNAIRAPLISLQLSPSSGSPMQQTPPTSHHTKHIPTTNSTRAKPNADANSPSGRVKSDVSTPLVSLLYSPSTPSLTGSEAFKMSSSAPTPSASHTGTHRDSLSLPLMSPILIKAEDIKKLRRVEFSK